MAKEDWWTTQDDYSNSENYSHLKSVLGSGGSDDFERRLVSGHDREYNHILSS